MQGSLCLARLCGPSGAARFVMWYLHDIEEMPRCKRKASFCSSQ
jgi:hypothetical protein